MIDYSGVLREIEKEVKPLFGKGKVADYIPALKKVNPKKFGISISTMQDENIHLGNSEELFSIQSVSKVFTLALAFASQGDALWKRVGKEPSGNPFNSLVQLEYEHGIPRNPFINAGALVITDILISAMDNPKKDVLDFLRRITGNKNINYNKEIAESEQQVAYRNAALVNYLKSYGNIHNDVDRVLELYTWHCSICMSCSDLAKSMLFLANHGVQPSSGEKILTLSQAKRLAAIMLTCGFYDQAGDFAFYVGLPGKSGVGGGIAAFIPGKLGIAVWSPELNKSGNSVVGMKALELFTTKTGISIFSSISS